MFCLRNQDITDAKAFFYLFFMSNSGYLKDKEFLVADRLTGTDFMMGFGLHALVYHMGQGENYPHIQRYVAGLSQLPSWQAAVQIEQNGVKSQK